MHNKIEITKHDGIYVVRDDLMPGGTKRRIASQFMHAGQEYVYATPAYGYAQWALALAAQEVGAIQTVFVAKRSRLHPLTEKARKAGAKIVQIPHGYMSNVRSKAKAYCETTGATLLPFGLDFQAFIDAIAEVARGVKFEPKEVWSVAGSGVLTRGLQQAWPEADFHVVQVGAVPNAGRARVWKAPESFEQDAKHPPPFPSCINYDAKAWQFIRVHAKPNALFWNVAA